MASGEKKQETTPDILRMGKKRISDKRIIQEDKMKLEPRWIFERTGKI